jgi:hypothetical protein
VSYSPVREAQVCRVDSPGAKLQVCLEEADAHFVLVNTLADQNTWDEVIAGYRRALGLKPEDTGRRHDLTNAFGDRGDLSQAINAYLRPRILSRQRYAQ